MKDTPKHYRILTKSGYYYATPNGRYGRFSEWPDIAWAFCEHHAKENLPWMKETGLEPRLVELDQMVMFCNQCDVNKRKVTI